MEWYFRWYVENWRGWVPPLVAVVVVTLAVFAVEWLFNRKKSG